MGSMPRGDDIVLWRAINRTRGTVLGSRVRTATSFLRRLKGLLGTRDLRKDEGLWIVPCSSIHSFGMRYPIDVCFLDRDGNVVGVFPDLSPNRMIRPVSRAAGALELPPGTLAETGTVQGDRVELIGNPS